MKIEDVPVYEEKFGTLRVSGSNDPRKTAGAAYNQFLAHGLPIEFTAIGANSGQQAVKAIGIFRHLIRRRFIQTNLDVAFQPILYKTETKDADGNMVFKFMTVWRTLQISLDSLKSDGTQKTEAEMKAEDEKSHSPKLHVRD